MTETDPTSPAALLRQGLFRIGDDLFSRTDVILWALLTGDWQQLRADVRAGLACRAHLDAGLVELDESAVKNAASEFRYSHRILSADETRSWLSARGIQPGEWMELIRRSLLRAQLRDELTQIVAKYPVTDDAVEACVMAEALCFGRLDELTRALAGRAALHASVAAAAVALAENQSGAATAAADPVEAVRLGLTADDHHRRLAVLQQIETTFRQRCDDLQTPPAIVAQIREHRLDWIQLQLALADFADESSAEEAVFCVREDGMTLEQVATSARVPLQRLTTYLEDVQSDLRDRLVGSGKGDVIGPLANGDRFSVIVVEDKVLADGDDPKLNQKARRSLIAAILARATHERVTWESAQ